MIFPKVSIIIPVYNPPKECFKICMESVLSQTYKEIEVILIDDGSKLDIASEMDKWSQQDLRVRVIHQDNQGVGNARNNGIALAVGKYICFVDSDDCMIDNWLSKAVEQAEQNNADIVYGSVFMTDTKSLHNSNNIKFQILTCIYDHSQLWRVQEMLLLNSNAKSPLKGLPYLDFGPCGKLFRADIVKQVLYPVDLPLAEDQVFNHIILRQSCRVVITNIPAYYYILNLNSATHINRPNAVEIMICAMKQIQTLLFNRQEVVNAFYCRLINEVTLGIQLSLFRNADDYLSCRMKNKKFNDIFSTDLVYEAVQNIKIDSRMNNKTKLKLKLLKNKVYYPFIILWDFKQWLEQKT